MNIALTVFYKIRNGSIKKGHTETGATETINYCAQRRRLIKVNCQVLLVCFTPNIRNGLAAQVRPDAETPAPVQQIKAQLIGTIIVTGRGEYEAVMRWQGSGIQTSRTHGDVFPEKRERILRRINYLQLNVQSTLVLTLTHFPKVSWAAVAAGNKRLSSPVLCYWGDGSNKPRAEQTDDRLPAAVTRRDKPSKQQQSQASSVNLFLIPCSGVASPGRNC